MGQLFTTRTDDGVTLSIEHFPAAGEPRGAVWLGHAILANRRSLDRAGGGLASTLAAAGLNAYAVDWRSHGSSGASDGGQWTYEDLLARDFPAVTRFVRERHPDLRLGVLGHSLTGHAALAWLATTRAPVDAIVTMGANVWLRQLEPSRVRWARKCATLALMTALAETLGRVPARELGYGSENVPRSFVREFIRWSASGRWAAPDGTDYLAALHRLRIPVLAVMAEGDDLLCHPVCGELFHRHLVRAPVEVVVAEGLGHMEMVTDRRARPLWARIAGWLAARLGSAAPA